MNIILLSYFLLVRTCSPSAHVTAGHCLDNVVGNIALGNFEMLYSNKLIRLPRFW